MDESEDLDRLEHLRKLNSNWQWVNHELYRLLYSEELYVVANERIKSKPGNMTLELTGKRLMDFPSEPSERYPRDATEEFRFKQVRADLHPKGERQDAQVRHALRQG